MWILGPYLHWLILLLIISQNAYCKEETGISRVDPNNQTNLSLRKLSISLTGTPQLYDILFPTRGNLNLYCKVTTAEIHYTTMSKAATPNEKTFDAPVGIMRWCLSSRYWPVAYLQPIACNQMHGLPKRNM